MRRRRREGTPTQPFLHPPHGPTSMGEGGEKQGFGGTCGQSSCVTSKSSWPSRASPKFLGKDPKTPFLQMHLSVHMGAGPSEQSPCKDVGWAGRTPRALTPPWCRADPSQGRGKLQPAGKASCGKKKKNLSYVRPQQSCWDPSTASVVGNRVCWVFAVATFLKPRSLEQNLKPALPSLHPEEMERAKVGNGSLRLEVHPHQKAAKFVLQELWGQNKKNQTCSWVMGRFQGAPRLGDRDMELAALAKATHPSEFCGTN